MSVFVSSTVFAKPFACSGMPSTATFLGNSHLSLRPSGATERPPGHIFEALGRREEAIADFRRALAKAPDLQGSKDALKRLGASP
jgi:regulator of sirC expression with transglutaminase-like and TPR domain